MLLKQENKMKNFASWNIHPLDKLLHLDSLKAEVRGTKH